MKSEYIDVFDQYFSGSLSDSETENFNSRLQSDTKFEHAFKEYSYLRDGINYSTMKTLKEELQELEATLPDVELEPDTRLVLEQISKSSPTYLWRAAAVIIVVAVSAGVLIFQQLSPVSSQDLFSQHFEPYPNEYVSAQRGEDVAANPLVPAFQAYDAQNYQSAISGFQSLLAREEQPLVLFYLGSAQLQEGLGADAIESFTRFLEISDELQVEAQWYLALSYMKESRVEEAKILLEELEQSEKRGKQAKRMLNQLQ